MPAVIAPELGFQERASHPAPIRSAGITNYCDRPSRCHRGSSLRSSGVTCSPRFAGGRALFYMTCEGRRPCTALLKRQDADGTPASGTFEAIAHAVESFDPSKCAVHHPELLADLLHMAVDCPIVDVDFIV